MTSDEPHIGSGTIQQLGDDDPPSVTSSSSRAVTLAGAVLAQLLDNIDNNITPNANGLHGGTTNATPKHLSTRSSPTSTPYHVEDINIPDYGAISTTTEDVIQETPICTCTAMGGAHNHSDNVEPTTSPWQSNRYGCGATGHNRRGRARANLSANYLYPATSTFSFVDDCRPNLGRPYSAMSMAAPACDHLATDNIVSTPKYSDSSCVMCRSTTTSEIIGNNNNVNTSQDLQHRTSFRRQFPRSEYRLHVARSSNSTTCSRKVGGVTQPTMGGERCFTPEPYTSVIEGFMFTCFLDYRRHIRPPPPHRHKSNYVKIESLAFGAEVHPGTCKSIAFCPRTSMSAMTPRHFSLFPATLSRKTLINMGASSTRSSISTVFPSTRLKEEHRNVLTTKVPVDVKELPKYYLFVVEVPGLKCTDVKVQVENSHTLKICGERKRDEKNSWNDISKCVHLERQGGAFARKFNLPSNIDLCGISASCRLGLLKIFVPKISPAPQHRARTFDISISP